MPTGSAALQYQYWMPLKFPAGSMMNIWYFREVGLVVGWLLYAYETGTQKLSHTQNNRESHARAALNLRFGLYFIESQIFTSYFANFYVLFHFLLTQS